MKYKDKEMMSQGAMSESPEVAMEIEIQSAEGADEMMYEEMAPSGNFSRKALNNLVKATNRLLPLFEQTPDYPQFGADISGPLPTDFVRVLAMFQGAVNAAVDADVLDEEMDFVMEDITDDQAIQALAGKIISIAGNRDFRSFLKNPPDIIEEEEIGEDQMMAEEGMPMTPESMTEEDIDSLFAGRM